MLGTSLKVAATWVLGLCMWLAPWCSCTPMVMDSAAFWQAGGDSGSVPLPGQWCILSTIPGCAVPSLAAVGSTVRVSKLRSLGEVI